MRAVINRRHILPFAIVFFASTGVLAQNTINVPGDQPTISRRSTSVILATLLLAPGTYTEDISFNGKAITVTSSGGEANTAPTGDQYSLPICEILPAP